MEEYLNQPKPKLPVAGQKFEIKEEEGDENWETELVEQSYNPLEGVQISDWSPILCCVSPGHQEEECSEED